MTLLLKKVTVEDLPVLKNKVRELQNGDCNLSLSSLVARADEYHIYYALIEDELVLRWQPYKDASAGWVIPLESPKIIEILRVIEEDAREHCEPLVLFGRFSMLTAKMESLMPYRNFVTISSNAWWDYLYRREDFIKLEGRKLHGKRNFVRRFWTAHPDARFVPITSENVGVCRRFLADWQAAQEEMTQGLIDEGRAIETALSHWDDFGLVGGLLMEGDAVFGFTYGAPVSDDIFAVHIEKAERSVAGAYPTLAVELGKSLPESFVYLNREEDLGIAGLRKAKQDWFPTEVLRKTFLKLEKEKEFGSNCKMRS
jgi:hypothetical protein